MLGQNRNTEALLGRKLDSVPGPQASPQRVTVNNEKIEAKQSVQTQSQPHVQKKKKKKKQTQFTSVLKIFNIIIGFCVIAFGISCYYFFSKQTQKANFVGIILPGYTAFSGFLIVLIQCNIGFIVRNMKFLYNFIGRGLFNIYVGVMPLSMVNLDESSDNQDEIFQILVFILVSLMCLIGVLYILAKIFCCAKQGNKRRKGSESDEDQD